MDLLEANQLLNYKPEAVPTLNSYMITCAQKMRKNTISCLRTIRKNKDDLANTTHKNETK